MSKEKVEDALFQIFLDAHRIQELSKEIDHAVPNYKTGVGKLKVPRGASGKMLTVIRQYEGKDFYKDSDGNIIATDFNRLILALRAYNEKIRQHVNDLSGVTETLDRHIHNMVSIRGKTKIKTRRREKGGSARREK